MPNVLRFVCYLIAALCFFVAAVLAWRPRPDTNAGPLAPLGLLFVVLPWLWDAAESLDA